MNETVVWHFAGKTLRDGSPLPAAGTCFDDPRDKNGDAGPVKPCVRGYHGSRRLIDALSYAPGTMLALRSLSGSVLPHGDPEDKLCASHCRMATGYVDVREVLVRFARHCALTALRVYAADALDAAGLHTHASSLRTLHDDCDLNAASDAASAASAASYAARAASYAASYAARVASYAASYAASDAASAASAASYAASYAARAASDAASADLNAWLEREVRSFTGWTV